MKKSNAIQFVNLIRLSESIGRSLEEESQPNSFSKTKNSTPNLKSRDCQKNQDNIDVENSGSEDESRTDVFRVEMVVGKDSPNTNDIQHCAYIDNRLKKGVFDACAKSIFNVVHRALDRNRCGDSVLLKRIQGTTFRSLNNRYFRRCTSSFPITAYSFQPTTFVVEITKARCVEIFYQIQKLLIADLRTQWPRERISLDIQEVLKKNTPDEASLFMAAKRLSMEKAQKAADKESWGSFEQRENGMTLCWDRCFKLTFPKQCAVRLKIDKAEFHKKKSENDKTNAAAKALAEISSTFIPEIDDW